MASLTNIAIAGKHSNWPKGGAATKKALKDFGAKQPEKDESFDYLVADEKSIESPTQLVKDAQTRGIPILKSQFLDDCKEAGKIVEVTDKHRWDEGGDSTYGSRGPTEEPEEPEGDANDAAQAAKDAEDKAAKDAADKAAKVAADKAAKDAEDKAAKDAADKAAKDAADKAAKDAEDKAAKDAADKAAKDAADKAAKDAEDKAAKDAADKAAKDAADKAAKDAADKAAKDNTDNAAKNAADKAAEETADKAAKDNTDNAAKNAANKAAKETTDKAAKNASNKDPKEVRDKAGDWSWRAPKKTYTFDLGEDVVTARWVTAYRSQLFCTTPGKNGHVQGMLLKGPDHRLQKTHFVGECEGHVAFACAKDELPERDAWRDFHCVAVAPSPYSNGHMVAGSVGGPIKLWTVATLVSRFSMPVTQMIIDTTTELAGQEQLLLGVKKLSAKTREDYERSRGLIR